MTLLCQTLPRNKDVHYVTDSTTNTGGNQALYYLHVRHQHTIVRDYVPIKNDINFTYVTMSFMLDDVVTSQCG
jgi:hypothetical protein